MRYVHIFIASSSELKQERCELVDLFADLNQDTFHQQNLSLKSEIWELWDSSMRSERKEDEYLKKLCVCDICIVLFWQTLGEYTLEELNVAVKKMQAGQLPKAVYVFFKEPSDSISRELDQFKIQFAERYSTIPHFEYKNYSDLRQLVMNILNNEISTLK